MADQRSSVPPPTPRPRLRYLPSKNAVHRLVAGKMIAIEGIQGAGKTTQGLRLAQALRAAGVPIESGAGMNGSPALKALNGIVEGAATLHIDAISEMLVASAAKRALVQNQVLPALDEGKWVLWEGFIGTTFPRYTATRNVNPDDAKAIEYIATGNYLPDLIILLHLTAEQAAQRNRGKGTLATLNREYRHEDIESIICETMHKAALADEAHWRIIDATQPIEVVAEAIVDAVRAHFPQSFAA